MRPRRVSSAFTGETETSYTETSYTETSYADTSYALPDDSDESGGNLFAPRAVVREPVYLLPGEPVLEQVEPGPKKAARAVAQEPERLVVFREQHYDWVWELAGFVICLAIAMLVFFTMPLT